MKKIIQGIMVIGAFVALSNKAQAQVTVTLTCPAITENLNNHNPASTPAGTIVTWHTATPATTANKVAIPTAVKGGVYYASFWDTTNNCYSSTSAALTVVGNICLNTPSVINTPARTAVSGNAATDLAPTGGTAPYTYSDASASGSCVAPSGATALPASSNLTVNSSTGAYSYTAPALAGTYYFCVQVCDSGSPAICKVATYTVVVGCASGSNVPTIH